MQGTYANISRKAEGPQVLRIDVHAYAFEDGPGGPTGTPKIFALGKRNWYCLCTTDPVYSRIWKAMREKARIYWIMHHRRYEHIRRMQAKHETDISGKDGIQTTWKEYGRRMDNLVDAQWKEYWVDVAKRMAPAKWIGSCEAWVLTKFSKHAVFIIRQMIEEDEELLWRSSVVFGQFCERFPAAKDKACKSLEIDPNQVDLRRKAQRDSFYRNVRNVRNVPVSSLDEESEKESLPWCDESDKDSEGSKEILDSKKVLDGVKMLPSRKSYGHTSSGDEDGFDVLLDEELLWVTGLKQDSTARKVLYPEHSLVQHPTPMSRKRKFDSPCGGPNDDKISGRLRRSPMHAISNDSPYRFGTSDLSVSSVKQEPTASRLILDPTHVGQGSRSSIVYNVKSRTRIFGKEHQFKIIGVRSQQHALCAGLQKLLLLEPVQDISIHDLVYAVYLLLNY